MHLAGLYVVDMNNTTKVWITCKNICLDIIKYMYRLQGSALEVNIIGDRQGICDYG